MATQRWTDEMLDRQAEQLTETREQIAALLEGQRLLVQIYQQEHEARVEAGRRFDRFIERQEALNQQLVEAVQELRRIVYFRPDNGSQS